MLQLSESPAPQTAVTGNINQTAHQNFKKASNTKVFHVDTAMGLRHAFFSKKSMILIAGSFAISITLFEATEQNAFHYNCFREHRLHLAETVSDSLYRLYYLGLPGFLSIFFRRPRTFEVLLSLEVNIRTGRLLSFRSFLIRY